MKIFGLMRITNKENIFSIVLIFVFAILIVVKLSPMVCADDLSPYYKFSGVKAPDSPYKNTWGAFQTDLFSGSFTYEYTFNLPPGTNGLTPKLSLRYNSHSAKGKAGWVGSGWEIPMNYIQRNINYTRNDTSDDKFELYLDGAENDLIYVAADGRFHTKNESYLKVEQRTDNSSPNSSKTYWVVTSTDGTEYRFGYNLDSENMVNTSDSSMTPYVWRWSLDQITDTNGNHIYYTYQENPTANDRGAVYLSRIQYNNDQKRTVEFVLESSDKPDMYMIIDQGSEVREARRLGEIRVWLDSPLVRKYTFAYSVNEAQNKSLLTSLTEYGADGVTSLPPVKFEYNPLGKGFGAEKAWPTPGERYIRKIDNDSNSASYQYGLIVDTFDVNGDGLPDLVSYDTSSDIGPHWDIWLNTGTGFNSTNLRWPIPRTESGTDWEWKVRSVRQYVYGKHGPNTRSAPMDMNGDGYVDFVWAQDDPYIKIAFNKGDGTGFVKDDTGSVLLIHQNVPDTGTGGIRVQAVQRPDDVAPNVKQELFDINGDGLPDIVAQDNNNCNKYCTNWHIWRNTGNGFVDYGSWSINPDVVYNNWVQDFTRGPVNQLQMGHFDVNGDGLPDIVKAYRSDGTWNVYLNTGSNFILADNYPWQSPYGQFITQMEDSFDDQSKNGNTIRDFFDINGDGLPDIVYINDPGSPTWTVYLNTGKGFTGPISWPVPDSGYIRRNDGNGNIKRDVFDIDGDGLPDLIRKPDSGSSWRIYPNLAGPADLLSKVTETFGGTVNVSYSSSSKYSNTRLPFNYWVVSSMTTNNGMSGSQAVVATTIYDYSKGLYDFPTREFRGFGEVTETRADGSKVVHSFYQDEAKKGKEYQTDTLDNANDLYASVANNFSETAANGVYISNLTRTEEATHDGVSAGPKKKAKEYQNYDSYGNVQLEIDYGDVDVAGDETYEYREFWSPCAPSQSWLVSKIKHKYILDQPSGAKLREGWFWYDDSTGCVSKGNLTTEMSWFNGGSNPVTTHQYDGYGNRIRSTDPENRTTQTEYDSTYHTFPQKIYNPLNQLYQKTFNPANGQPTQETDPNGFITQFVYDTFQRKVKEIRPYDSDALPTTSIQYLIDGVSPEGIVVSKRETGGGGGTLDTIQLVDGFGNLIQTKSEYENSANKIIQDIFYDTMGRVKKQSNPYLGDSSNDYSSPDTGVAGTNYDYDPIGRPTLITNPDGTTISRVFDHWTVTETDENSHAKSYVFNSQQKLTRVIENNQGAAYTTNYTYNPLSELTRITDQLGNISTFAYDTLGRKINMVDPDLGTWQYGYDLTGNLTSQTDARGITTAIQYDGLNRKTKISYPNSPGYNFIYDTNTIGTLERVEESLGSIYYSYDQRLRKVKEERTLDGKTYTTLWNYDALDRVTRMTYPGGKSTDFNYNSQGKLDSIPGIMNHIDYNAQGQITLKSYASGKSTTLNYHPQNQRLTKIATPGLQDLSYGYDNVGNITLIADAVAGRTENFTYDGLDRLIQAGDSGYSIQYQYDALGNMLSMNKDGRTFNESYGTGGVRPHAVNGSTGPYPVVGSIILDNGNKYTLKSTVTINNISYGNPTQYLASENKSFTGGSWQPYSAAPVFNLSSGYGVKTVYFKVKNADGESDAKSDSIEVIQSSSPPSVTTGQASNVKGHSATLNGTVNPNGLSTIYYFQWGTTTGYGNKSPATPASAGSGWDNVAVLANLTGLTLNTTYHYRLVATNNIGTTYGADISFKAVVNLLPWLMLLLGE